MTLRSRAAITLAAMAAAFMPPKAQEKINKVFENSVDDEKKENKDPVVNKAIHEDMVKSFQKFINRSQTRKPRCGSNRHLPDWQQNEIILAAEEKRLRRAKRANGGSLA